MLIPGILARAQTWWIMACIRLLPALWINLLLALILALLLYTLYNRVRHGLAETA